MKQAISGQECFIPAQEYVIPAQEYLIIDPE